MAKATVSSPGGNSPTRDQIITERVKRSQQLANSFLVDLARVMAGWPEKLSGYMPPHLAGDIVEALEPFHTSGDVLHPNFGEYSRVDTIGDLDKTDKPVMLRITFEDQSVRQNRNGGPKRPVPRRSVVIELAVSPDLERITDIEFHWRDGPTAG